jgi:RNA polymerase-binding protein DksA
MPANKKKRKLTKKEIEYFKKKILAERERILKELGRIEESINAAAEDQNGSNQSYSNHLADLGTDYMEKEKNFYYASQEGHYLRSLDEALERIERGEYGFCLDCGELITRKRLEVVPSAKLCVDCKSNQEKQERGR